MSAQPQPYPAWGQPLLGGSRHTADDVERMPDDGFRYEVYRGVLIRMPGTGGSHGAICQFIGRFIDDYWRGLGERYRVRQNMGFDFSFTGDPAQSTMLVPDVAVTADNSFPDPGIGQTPPLIAIEVASPSDYRPQMAMKASFYLNSGVKEVWVVWPKTRTMDVWTAPNASTTYSDQQSITSILLPGFSCAISHFFEG